MPETRLPAEEMAPLGDAAYKRISGSLRPDDAGKFVAIDIDSDDHEVDADDYAAVHRLLARRPGARIWLAGVGRQAAYRLGRLT